MSGDTTSETPSISGSSLNEGPSRSDRASDRAAGLERLGLQRDLKTRVIKVTRMSPRAKGKASRGEKPKIPELTAPLSIMTRDYVRIPIKDMEAYVNRPVEKRMAEAEKRGGIARPMNSFILYRAAFADRTKKWCEQNNHQVVSSVSGQSWPMEPAEVREKYNEYARVERINHQNAHPEYKFSPSKNVSGKSKKGHYSEGDYDDETSDLTDADGEWGPPGRRTNNNGKGLRKARQTRHQSDNILQVRSPNFGSPRFNLAAIALDNRSWEIPNEGRPLPVAYSAPSLYNQYYPQMMNPTFAMSNASDENMRLHAESQQYAAQSLTGLPGGQHHELLQLQPHNCLPLPQDSQVDPMLLAYDGHTGSQQDQSLLMSNVGRFGTSMDQSQYHAIPWNMDTSNNQMEDGPEFDKWD